MGRQARLKAARRVARATQARLDQLLCGYAAAGQPRCAEPACWRVTLHPLAGGWRPGDRPQPGVPAEGRDVLACGPHRDLLRQTGAGVAFAPFPDRPPA